MKCQGLVFYSYTLLSSIVFKIHLRYFKFSGLIDKIEFLLSQQFFTKCLIATWILKTNYHCYCPSTEHKSLVNRYAKLWWGFVLKMIFVYVILSGINLMTCGGGCSSCDCVLEKLWTHWSFLNTFHDKRWHIFTFHCKMKLISFSMESHVNAIT